MDNTKREVTNIIDNEARDFARYSGAGRALPNMIDGFKPVHRFLIQRSLDLCKQTSRKTYHKLTSIAGSVSDLGYHHTENAAQDAAALLSNTWNNVVPFMDGRGNFGSRIVQEAGASRYIYARISDNFFNIFKDIDNCPPHEDIEHIPPKFYLPVIPTILLNGIRGMAIGYACIIMPHDINSIAECTKLALQGKLDKEPTVIYPNFKGGIFHDGGSKYELHGVYDIISKTVMEITELPYKWDREKYITKVLEPLKAKGFISYEDGCDKNGFHFKIKFRKEYILPSEPEKLHKKIMKEFGLIEKITQNITVSDVNSDVVVFQKASDLIKEFVKVRLPFVQLRIDSNIKDYERKRDYANAKIEFIKKVISGEIATNSVKRKELLASVRSYDSLKEYADELVSMNIYHMTTDECDKLEKNLKEVERELKYWNSTTKEKEYLKDIEELL